MTVDEFPGRANRDHDGYMVPRNYPRRRMKRKSQSVFYLRQDLSIQGCEAKGPLERRHPEQHWNFLWVDRPGRFKALENRRGHKIGELFEAHPPLRQRNFPRGEVGPRLSVPKVGFLDIADPGTHSRETCRRVQPYRS